MLLAQAELLELHCRGYIKALKLDFFKIKHILYASLHVGAMEIKLHLTSFTTVKKSKIF